MLPYEINLLLETLASEFTLEELEDTDRIIPFVSLSCKLSRESSRAIVEGAQDLKVLREDATTNRKKPRKPYIQ